MKKKTTVEHSLLNLRCMIFQAINHWWPHQNLTIKYMTKIQSYIYNGIQFLTLIIIDNKDVFSFLLCILLNILCFTSYTFFHHSNYNYDSFSNFIIQYIHGTICLVRKKKRHGRYPFLPHKIINDSLDLFGIFIDKWFIWIKNISFWGFLYYYGSVFKKWAFMHNICNKQLFNPSLNYIAY